MVAVTRSPTRRQVSTYGNAGCIITIGYHRRALGKAVYETRRGAAGSVFAAHVSADAPEEVLLALVKEAAEISKLSIGAVASESTKVDVGASGKVALRIDKGLSFPVFGQVTVFHK